MLGKAQNPTLQAVEQAVMGKVKPEQKKAVERIVTAGIKVMYSEQTRSMLSEQLGQQGDPAEVAGEGIAKLVALLFKESKGTMPMDAGMLAAQILLLEGLDFLEQSGRVQATPEVVASATKSMIAYLLQLFGVSQDKLAEMMAAGGSQQGQEEQVPEQAQPAGIVAAARGGE
jgi:RNA 3'-terminal phosphate cyclase